SAQRDTLPGGWQSTLLSDSLWLETGTVILALGSASISSGAHSHERSTNCIHPPNEPSAADHRYRTGSIDSSGVSPSQSCLKNSAHLSNFFGARTVSACCSRLNHFKFGARPIVPAA